MSLPNLITVGRLLAVPFLVWLILIRETGWAFWLFAAAGVSDAVDGLIARTFQAQTRLGGYLDPLADKALLVGAYAALGSAGYVPLWLVIFVIFRDVVIVGGVLLLYTLKESVAMQPLFISKVNTAAQLVLASAVLAVNGLGIADPGVVEPLVWLVAATTVVSLLAYIALAGRILSREGLGP